MRTEHALARHALSRRPDILFSFYDKPTASFLSIDPAWIERLIGWDHALDMVTLDVRRNLRGLARLRPSRYPPTMALERWRLVSRRPAIRHLIDLGQRLMWLPRGLPPPFADSRGRRFGVVPMDCALGAPLALGPNDVIVSVGDDWFHKDVTAIAGSKQRLGFCYVVMCHDLIPVMFPAWYPEGDTTLFRRHWLAMFPIADSILVNSRKVAADIRAFCAQAEIGLGRIVPVRPGYDPARNDPALALPSGLEPGKYALFVGTIEPRKGHAMLLDVWRRLLAEGLPQRRGFKLVLVERPGWQVEDVLRQIADGVAFQGTLRHFTSVDDAMLDGLYRDAAFCLYPSIYEGFGLPVIEALAHGKAVIASTGAPCRRRVVRCRPACRRATAKPGSPRSGAGSEILMRAPYEKKSRNLRPSHLGRGGGEGLRGDPHRSLTCASSAAQGACDGRGLGTSSPP